VLHLLPGERAPDGSLHSTPAPDIPPDPVFVAVPVYPGAEPATSTSTEPVGLGPDSPYIKSAAVMYAAPTDPEAAVTWYAQAFTACGYVPGPGSAVMQGSGQVTRVQAYSSPTIPSLNLGLSIAPSPAGGALIEYEAAALSFPPRPRASQVAWTARKVEMTFDAGAYGEPRPGKALSLTITNRTMTFALANAVNALQNPPLVHSCGPFRGAVVMVFVAAHKKMTVTDGCRDVTVDSFPPLADDYREVWTTARLIVAEYCAKHRCRRG
jgi:hypothetical protein